MAEDKSSSVGTKLSEGIVLRYRIFGKEPSSIFEKGWLVAFFRSWDSGSGILAEPTSERIPGYGYREWSKAG